MNLEFINNLIRDYQEIISDEGMDLFNERGTLARVREAIEWQSLTSEEKHQKRRFIFRVISKKGNPEVFTYEIKIIEIYELVEQILQKVNSIEAEFDLKTRLIAMSEVFKYHVNEHRDTKKMQKTSLDLLKNIAAACLKSESFNTIKKDLNNLIDEIEKLQNIQINDL